jgi:hypothetical protein
MRRAIVVAFVISSSLAPLAALAGSERVDPLDAITQAFTAEVDIPLSALCGELTACEDDTSEAPLGPAERPLSAHADYRELMAEATEDRKMLLVCFHQSPPSEADLAFERLTLASLEVRERLARYVVLRLSGDTHLQVDGREIRLLDHPAFAEMLGRSGVAIIDLMHEQAEYFGHVVSAFPFTPGEYFRPEALSIILDLPPGSLTQRKMVYAVRIHPELPASTQGQFHQVLADEATSHAQYQAAILLQGHHGWDGRFQRINARLPNGLVAKEVVAESWPNETLVEACVDCVDSWRQSAGHWNAVRARHGLFAYDIHRGRNGIWYATGIFGGPVESP